MIVDDGEASLCADAALKNQAWLTRGAPTSETITSTLKMLVGTRTGNWPDKGVVGFFEKLIISREKVSENRDRVRVIEGNRDDHLKLQPCGVSAGSVKLLDLFGQKAPTPTKGTRHALKVNDLRGIASILTTCKLLLLRL